MAYSFRIDADRGVVLFKAADPFSVDDFMTCVDKVVTNPLFESHFDHLVDMRDVKTFEPKGADVRIRAHLDHGDKRLDASRIAIVSSGDVVFGMSRMYETLMGDASVKVRAFRDMAEATAWLGLPAGEVKF
jgi:hypothetical protein